MKRALSIVLLLVVTVLGLHAGAPSHTGKPFFQNISSLEYDGHNRNFDIVCADEGKVIVANFEGFLIWNGVRWKMIHTPGVSRITDLYRAGNGQVWFGGNNLFGYFGTDDTPYYVVNDSDSLYRFGEVRNISSSEDGNGVTFETDEGWYALADGVLDRTHEGHGHGETSNGDINSVMPIPDQGLTAVATKSEGVIVTDSDGHEKYRVNSDDGLCSDNISSLAYDGKGTLWGTTDNGIFKISVSPVFTRFTRTDGLLGQVTSILSRDGLLLAGTLQGLYVKKSGETSFRKCKELNLACWQIAASSDGRIYAATAQGLYLFDGVGLRQLTSHHTLSLLPGPDGTVLLGEANGMCLLHSDFREEKLNDISGILKMAPDSTGGILAVRNSMESFHADDFHSGFKAVSSTNRSLLMEYVDDAGRFWHAGEYNDGIRCEELPHEEAVWLRMLDRNSIDAMYIDGSSMFVGGNFGMVAVDMDGMKKYTPYRPDIVFRSIDVGASSVECSFSADKTDPSGEIRYSYRLHEDGEWSPWSTDNTISFEHLQSGRYSLSVRCLDSFGSTDVTEPVAFRIPAPIYLRWYSICFYVILISILAAVFQQIKLRNLRINEARLQQQVEKRTAQLREAQGQLLRQERDATVGKLTKGLIDRILNPMNYINNFSHLSIGLARDLQEDIEDEKESMTSDNYEDCVDVITMLNTNLSKIEQHGLSTTRILKAMEELLKDRSGKIEPTDMVQICTKDYEMFRQYNRESIDKYGVQLKWHAPEGPVEVMADKVNISKAIMSVLANSIYAVVKKSRKTQHEVPVVELTLTKGEDGHGCTVTVHDNGVGIAESIMDKIFDPFYTDKPTSEASGVGLYLSRQAVQDMGGTMEVRSEKDLFTDVIIKLPK